MMFDLYCCDKTMGFNLYCCDKTYSSSYIIWNNVRNTLIESTFEYILIHFGVTDYEEGTFEYNSMCMLKQYIEKILDDVKIIKERDLLDIFINIESPKFYNLLIQFGVGGIYTLCNKTDNEGFYSVGNSYDICELIKLVKPFLLKDRKNIDSQNNWLYNCIDNITNVFEESVKQKEIVRITSLNI